MYPSANWSRYYQQRRDAEDEMRSTVEDDGLQGPSKTRRPFPRDTRGAA